MHSNDDNDHDNDSDTMMRGTADKVRLLSHVLFSVTAEPLVVNYLSSPSIL